MPRNLTGGSGHKAQRNSEAPKAKKNRGLVDDLLDDLTEGRDISGVFVGRVTKRIGHGQMEVFYIEEKSVRDKVTGKEELIIYEHTKIMPMAGSLTGKGKGAVWVDVGSLVRIDSTGLSRTTHEIVAVFQDEQVKQLKKLRIMDERMFAKEGDDDNDDEGGVVFENAEEEEEKPDEGLTIGNAKKEKYKKKDVVKTAPRNDDDDVNIDAI